MNACSANAVAVRRTEGGSGKGPTKKGREKRRSDSRRSADAKLLKEKDKRQQPTMTAVEPGSLLLSSLSLDS